MVDVSHDLVWLRYCDFMCAGNLGDLANRSSVKIPACAIKMVATFRIRETLYLECRLLDIARVSTATQSKHKRASVRRFYHSVSMLRTLQVSRCLRVRSEWPRLPRWRSLPKSLMLYCALNRNIALHCRAVHTDIPVQSPWKTEVEGYGKRQYVPDRRWLQTDQWRNWLWVFSANLCPRLLLQLCTMLYYVSEKTVFRSWVVCILIDIDNLGDHCS